MMEEPIYLSLGTNLGDRCLNLLKARDLLLPDVLTLRASSVYATPPWGYEDQPEFLNQVLEVRTDLPPVALLSRLKSIEAEMGREKTFRYGPRLIDLDILFYGGQVLETETLQIPHPRLHERAFVLVPLHEIAPDFVHPVLGETLAELLDKLGDVEGVRRL